VAPDPMAADPGSRRAPAGPLRTRASTARALRESRALRRRLARLADAVAVTLEEHATVHDRMAAQDRTDDDAGHAARVRELAAAERVVAQAYRDGTRPPDAVRGTIRG
jgi:hypothetical protein